MTSSEYLELTKHKAYGRVASLQALHKLQPVNGSIVHVETKKLGKVRKHIGVCCPSCQIVRWVKATVIQRQGFTTMCRSCFIRQVVLSHSYSNLPLEQRPRKRSRAGYLYVRLFPNEPFYNMASGKNHNAREIPEHRLVMATHLDRLLTSSEIIHHLNGIKSDNRLENLCLTNSRKHEKRTFEKQLQQHIRNLENEIAILSQR